MPRSARGFDGLGSDDLAGRPADSHGPGDRFGQAPGGEGGRRGPARRLRPHDGPRRLCRQSAGRAFFRAAATKVPSAGSSGGRGRPKALKAVSAAAKDADPAVRDAAYRALGEWTSADAGPELLSLAKTTGDGKLQTRALRGYIRVTRQFNIPDSQRLAMYGEILSLAKRDDEKRIALDVLKQVISAESLALAVENLDKPALQQAAARVSRGDLAEARRLAARGSGQGDGAGTAGDEEQGLVGQGHGTVGTAQEEVRIVKSITVAFRSKEALLSQSERRLCTSD